MMSWIDKASKQVNSSRSNQQWNIHDQEVDKWVRHYKSRLIKEANLKTITTLNPNERKQTIERLVMNMIEDEKVILPSKIMQEIIEQLINESVGYGPLEALLQQEEITEIMVNGLMTYLLRKMGS